MDAEGSLARRTQCPTPPGFEDLLHWINGTVQGWTGDASRTACAIAVPGVVVSGQRVARSVNLPWLENQPLGSIFRERLGTACILLSDIDAATWGEFCAAGRPAKPFAHVRLGTGVGCGIVVDGALLPADPGRRTHWPMLVADPSPDAPECACGLRGCLELYASGKALRAASIVEGFADPAELQKAFKKNEPSARRIINNTASAVCAVLLKLHSKLGVQMVCLGGGVFRGLPALGARIVERLQSAPTERRPLVRESLLGDDAGLIGAARLAQGLGGQAA